MSGSYSRSQNCLVPPSLICYIGAVDPAGLMLQPVSQALVAELVDALP